MMFHHYSKKVVHCLLAAAFGTGALAGNPVPITLSPTKSPAAGPPSPPANLIPNACDEQFTCAQNLLTPGERCCSKTQEDSRFYNKCGYTYFFCHWKNCRSGPCREKPSSSPSFSSRPSASPSVSAVPSTSSQPSESPSQSLVPTSSIVPSESPSEVPSAVPTKTCDEMQVQIKLKTDWQRSVYYWTLTNSCGNLAAYSEDKYEKAKSLYTTYLCLPSDEYIFTIYSTSGEGMQPYTGLDWLGAWGYYEISIDGKSVVKVGESINDLWYVDATSVFGEAAACSKTSIPTSQPTTRMPTPTSPVTPSPTHSLTQAPTRSPIPHYLLPNGCDEAHSCDSNPLTPGERCCSKKSDERTFFSGLFKFNVKNQCGYTYDYCGPGNCLNGPCWSTESPTESSSPSLSSSPSTSLRPSSSPSLSSSPSTSPSSSLSPSNLPSVAPSETCIDMNMHVQVKLKFRKYDSGNYYWTLTNNCGQVVAHSEEYDQSETEYTTWLCLPSDKYNFTIYDCCYDDLFVPTSHKIIVDGITALEVVGFSTSNNESHSSFFGVATACLSTSTPTSKPTTFSPTLKPTTLVPTPIPTTAAPTSQPTTFSPTLKPTTLAPTPIPTTAAPTSQPTTLSPTLKPTTLAPTPMPTMISPTSQPTTLSPTLKPTTLAPTPKPKTASPTTLKPMTPKPTTVSPTMTPKPTTPKPTTASPMTPKPTTPKLTTASPTTPKPSSSSIVPKAPTKKPTQAPTKKKKKSAPASVFV